MSEQLRNKIESVIGDLILLAAKDCDPLMDVVEVSYNYPGAVCELTRGVEIVKTPWGYMKANDFGFDRNDATAVIGDWAHRFLRMCHRALLEVVINPMWHRKIVAYTKTINEAYTTADVVIRHSARPVPVDAKRSFCDDLPRNLVVGVDRGALELRVVSKSLIMINDSATTLSEVTGLEFVGSCVCIDPSKVTIWTVQ